MDNPYQSPPDDSIASQSTSKKNVTVIALMIAGIFFVSGVFFVFLLATPSKIPPVSNGPIRVESVSDEIPASPTPIRETP